MDEERCRGIVTRETVEDKGNKEAGERYGEGRPGRKEGK